MVPQAGIAHLTVSSLLAMLVLSSLVTVSRLQETSIIPKLQSATTSADVLVPKAMDSQPCDKCLLIKKCMTEEECPFWTMYNHTTGDCECRKEYISPFDGIIECNDGKLSVLACYCVTYTNNISTGHDSIVAGSCMMNCMRYTRKPYDKVYLTLPVNLSEINTKVCGTYFNRSGRLCGQCRDGYQPLAYSFEMACVNCTEHESTSNLFIFFTLVFLPITMFYFIVLFFKINVTSSYLHGFVLLSQAVSFAAFSKVITLDLDQMVVYNSYQTSYQQISMSIRVLISLYGIWSLNFFQMASPGICLAMSPLAVRALDYSIALYPFFLTALSYVLIEVHDRNFRPLVVIWRPFWCVFTMFRRQWNIRTSVIDAYATFYLLSLFKILSITFDMLSPVRAYDLKVPNGTEYTYVLYYDGNIEYFGAEHLPYAIPAITIAVLFVVLPAILLLFYPCRCFQYLLNRTNCRWHILHMVMDSFQGCFKDGTEPGTRDCRYFAGVYILLRIILFIVYSFTHNSMVFPLSIYVILAFVIIITNVQPHKETFSHYNRINVTFLNILALYFVGITSVNIASLKDHYFLAGCFIFTALVGLTPLIYMLCIVIHWAITNRRCGKVFVSRVRDWWKGYDPVDGDSLPDRIANPNDYEEMDGSVDVELETEHENSISYH